MLAELANPLTAVPAALVAALILYILLTFLIHSLNKIRHPAVAPLRLLRNFALPLGLGMAFLIFFFNQSPESLYFRVSETALFCLFIWIVPSLIKELIFRNPGSHTGEWRATFPELFLDLVRFSLVAVGISLVFATVWGSDLGGFFATLGVGSIVLGLALQDTLGNLIAGIALLFERPFALGDWVKIGESVGMVREMNWRAVHLFTLDECLIVVPNSMVGKEQIKNFSRPQEAHEVELKIGFSYDDPPNKVKEVLRDVAKATNGINDEGILVRTINYGDSAVTYEIRFMIANYGLIEDVSEDFLTQVWYAAKRNGLNIPYPIRTVYKTEIPYNAPADLGQEIRTAISKVDLFRELLVDELAELSAESVIANFGKGEIIFDHRELGDNTLYVIRSGQVRVFLREGNTEQELARLGPGNFFGEMSLLTGEPRSAGVAATEDVEVISVSKKALEPLLRKRPAIAESFAEIIASRRRNTQEARSQLAENSLTVNSASAGRTELLKSIYRFFSLSYA